MKNGTKNQKRFLIVLGFALVGGASFSFADGMLNDGETTRAKGGVGNYLFYGTSDLKTTEADTTPVLEPLESEAPVVTQNDTLNLGASSAGRAH